ncbi:hypothetical protein BEE12_08820 [Pantoea agglomerans]|uniref:hypothetical protein n=1 Tax=Enterobacter agglomerans TaxID=549 RepID=UPI00083D98AF|nr:hypothetical protein [Pantoea agglomerans]AOE39948.1 hypothetical protein BEE12_08820 [Pantoea agglomerans]
MREYQKVNVLEVLEGVDLPKYCIRDGLLAGCVGWRYNYLGNVSIQGFSEGKAHGYVLLLMFLSKAFGIHRLPSHEDRIFHEYMNPLDKKKGGVVNEIINGLSEANKDAICNELHAIYENTQNILSNAQSKHVFLQRSIRSGYKDKVLILKAAAEILGKEKIPVDMDVLNSFTDYFGSSAYGDVSFRMNIPAEDILCSHLFISSKYDSMAMEREEWIVMNRSATGIVDVNVSDIYINEREAEKNKKDEIKIDVAFNKLKSNMSIDFAKKLFSCNPCEVWRYPYKYINSYL